MPIVARLLMLENLDCISVTTAFGLFSSHIHKASGTCRCPPYCSELPSHSWLESTRVSSQRRFGSSSVVTPWIAIVNRSIALMRCLHKHRLLPVRSHSSSPPETYLHRLTVLGSHDRKEAEYGQFLLVLRRGVGLPRLFWLLPCDIRTLVTALPPRCLSWPPVGLPNRFAS